MSHDRKYIVDPIPDYILDMAINVVEKILDNRGTDVYILAKKFVAPLFDDYSEERLKVRTEEFERLEEDLEHQYQQYLEEVKDSKRWNEAYLSLRKESDFDKEKLKAIQAELDKEKNRWSMIKAMVEAGRSLEKVYGFLMVEIANERT